MGGVENALYQSDIWRKYKNDKLFEPKSVKVLKVFFVSVLELVSVLILSLTWFYRPFAYDNLFIVVIMFSVLMCCLVFKNGEGSGIVSKLLNHLFPYMGKYSYSIYVMQQICFYILQRTLWEDTYLLENHIIVSMVLSMLFCATVGIITYYIVERPMVLLYKRISAGGKT